MWKRAKQHHVPLHKDLLLSGSSAAGVLTLRVRNIYNSCMDTGFCSTFRFKFWDVFTHNFLHCLNINLQAAPPGFKPLAGAAHVRTAFTQIHPQRINNLFNFHFSDIYISLVASPRSVEWADWLKEIYVTEKKTNKAQAHCLILSGLMPSWATWRRNKRERNNCYWFEQILFDL